MRSIRAFFKTLFNLIKILFNLVAMLVGIGFVAIAYFYYVTPAGILPPQMPGFLDKVNEPNMQYAAGSLAIGLAAFLFAWMVSGIAKKKSLQAPDNLTATETLKL